MEQDKKRAAGRFARQLSLKETVWRSLILFALVIAGVIYYFPQLLQALVAILGIVFPFIIGALIAFVLNTIFRLLRSGARRFLHWKVDAESKSESLLKILTILLLIGIVILFVVVIVPEMLRSFQMLIAQLPTFIARAENWISSLSTNYPFLSDWLAENEPILNNVPSALENAVNFLFNGGFSETLSGVFNTLTSTFSSVFSAFLSIMFALIAFFNSDRIIGEFKLVTMAFLPEKQYEKLAYVSRKSVAVFTNFISGSLLDALTLGTLVGLMTLLFGIPYPLITALICGFFALIPLFGGFISEILCTLLILIVDPWKALLFAVLFIILQQVDDNLIYPNIVGKSTGLPSIYVLIAVTLGAGLAGFVGMLLAIPIATVIYDLIGEQAVFKLKRRNYPEEQKQAVFKILELSPEEQEEMVHDAQIMDDTPIAASEKMNMDPDTPGDRLEHAAESSKKGNSPKSTESTDRPQKKS